MLSRNIRSIILSQNFFCCVASLTVEAIQNACLNFGEACAAKQWPRYTGKITFKQKATDSSNCTNTVPLLLLSTTILYKHLA